MRLNSPTLNLRSAIAGIQLLALLLLAAACRTTPRNGITQPIALPSPQVAKETKGRVSPISSVDFGNFTYRIGDASDPVTLIDGGSQLGKKTPEDIWERLTSVVYADLNGDREDEAIVVLTVMTGGSAVPHEVYIYCLEDERPKLLWHFVSGDRADGGLRSVSAEDGQLVVELYGRNRIIGGNLFQPDDGDGDCCPKVFTRTRYEWRKNKFHQVGKPGIIPNPYSSASLLMPYHEAAKENELP